jgi:dTDP-4-amino-4,6-dideoxygalactose transaminase
MTMAGLTRRTFLSMTGAAAALGSRHPRAAAQSAGPAAGPPAILGGTPVRTAPFPCWPVSDALEEDALTDVLRSGRWNRASRVDAFEREYAALTGTAHCLATANGTSALLTALAVLDVGPGDEVILPPYTFVATINVVLQRLALPVFVDSDIETFQIDAGRIAAAITPRTKLIMPVHLGGSAADLDAILPLAQSRHIPVLEDACQAHLAEWRGRKVGSLGIAGAFSFQASKNLNSGEGGALITNDAKLAEAAYAFHNNSTPRGGGAFGYRGPGLNLRLTDFQAAVLLSQMTRLAVQAARRDENGAYLTRQLGQIDGITPARMYAGCTRNAYHLYMFRYDATKFGGLPREGFLRALRAEGVPASGGYTPLNKVASVTNTLASKSYARIYGADTLGALAERNACPVNDRLCREAVWLAQTVLLGSRADMDDVAAAVRRIQASGTAIAAKLAS